MGVRGCVRGCVTSMTNRTILKGCHRVGEGVGGRGGVNGCQRVCSGLCYIHDQSHHPKRVSQSRRGCACVGRGGVNGCQRVCSGLSYIHDQSHHPKGLAGVIGGCVRRCIVK